MGKRGDNQTETPLAAQAFADYLALGDKRSLRELAAEYVRRNRYKTETTAFNQLATWSTAHRWQDRIAAAVTAEAQAALERAAEIDARSFLRTSEMLAERLDMTNPIMLDVLVKVRESVRKPAPKGGSTVNVNVSVEIRELAERMAKEAGLDPDAVIAEAESILGGRP